MERRVKVTAFRYMVFAVAKKIFAAAVFLSVIKPHQGGNQL